MASCTRIEHRLQAYIDGELGDSDRVILEEHLAQCTSCAAQLRAHQWTSALLFETLATDRLSHSLRQRVLDHLPEMETPMDDIEEVNWRAKHPDTWATRLTKLMPVASVAILIFLTVMLRFSYPDSPSYTNVARELRDPLGVIAYAAGGASRFPFEETQRQMATVGGLVRPDDHFETPAGTSMMLSLAGPTVVKMAENTSLKVLGARRLSVDEGAVWVDVARIGSQFKVVTPGGLITVLGTTFSVRVDGLTTTVIVERGEVHVESGAHVYRLNSNQQVVVSAAGASSGPVKVDAVNLNAWARAIVPDPGAETLFVQLIQSKAGTAELPGRVAFVIDTLQGGKTREIDAIRIYWSPEDDAVNLSSYEVTVSDGAGGVLAESHLDAALLRTRGLGFFDVIPKTPIRNVRTLVVRLIPDHSTGDREIDSFEVKAKARIGDDN